MNLHNHTVVVQIVILDLGIWQPYVFERENDTVRSETPILGWV